MISGLKHVYSAKPSEESLEYENPPLVSALDIDKLTLIEQTFDSDDRSIGNYPSRTN